MRHCFMFLLGFSLLSACTPTPTLPELKTGAPLFKLQPTEVQELTLSRNDPQTSSNWNARVKKTQLSDTGSPLWELQSGPQGETLMDPLADSNWVNHFLDTLQTLEYSGPAPQSTLENLGLAKPWAIVVLNTASRIELRIGDRKPDSEIRYALSSLSGETPIEIRGAALKMLEYASQFQTLRRQALITWTADDADTMEVSKNGKAIIKAERQGADWILHGKKTPQPKIGEALEALTHLRALRFVDDADRATSLLQELKKAPNWSVTLKDRKDHPEVFRAIKREGKLWANWSARPKTVVELYPMSEMILDRFISR